MAKSKEDIEEVVQRVIDGTATEADKGLVLKTMKNSLSANLVSSLGDMYTGMQDLNNLVSDAVSLLKEQYEMNRGLMDMKALMEFIDSVQTRQLKLMELNRKISQGSNNLFANDSLSDEEKQVLKLFKSFRTNDEKKRFMRLVAQELQNYS